MNFVKFAVRWGLYPLSWAVILCLFSLALFEHISFEQAYGYMLPGLFVTYLVLERVVPYERRWAMTWRSFFLDFKYMVINGATIALVKTVLGFYAISTLGQSDGFASSLPFIIQLISILMIFEFMNYSIHRIMHEARGETGTFLWKVHAAHHLPDRVYILMHVAGHPINAVIVQTMVIVLPIWLMGYDQSVVTLFLMLNAMHGLISHFNVDVRLGYLNYIFIGPETHRYHHSARMSEAKNYGATISLYDQMFGTFIYRQGMPPENLGVSKGQGLPAYGNILQVLKLPFTKQKLA